VESEELKIVSGFIIKPLPKFWIKGFARLFRGDGATPVGSDILDLQLIGSACEESTDEKKFLIPYWSVL